MTATDLTALALTILIGALVSGTPLLFATLGEIFSERSGVMNLGIEGMMLMGAMGGFATWYRTGNILLAFIVGMAFGGLLALLHAFITITLRADQVPSDALALQLREHVAHVIGPIARPKFLLFTPDLPKTRSGKIMRRLLRDISEGRTLGDTTTLADVGVVDTIRANTGRAEE